MTINVCEVLMLIIQTGILGVIVLGLYDYIKLRRWLAIVTCRVKMNCDELIDQLLQEEQSAAQLSQERTSACAREHSVSASTAASETNQKHRERLAAVAAGGQARQYLGKVVSVDQVDAMDDEEVQKLYARYEARLGAAMTKTLGQAALQLYAGMASMLLPIPTENRPALVADLEADPFVGHALSSATCELYHRYGTYLAPLTAAVTTAKHCQFGQVEQQQDTSDQDGGRDSCTARDHPGGAGAEGDSA